MNVSENLRFDYSVKLVSHLDYAQPEHNGFRQIYLTPDGKLYEWTGQNFSERETSSPVYVLAENLSRMLIVDSGQIQVWDQRSPKRFNLTTVQSYFPEGTNFHSLTSDKNILETSTQFPRKNIIQGNQTMTLCLSECQAGEVYLLSYSVPHRFRKSEVYHHLIFITSRT